MLLRMAPQTTRSTAPGESAASVSDLIAAGERSISFEFFPPKDEAGEDQLWRAISALEPSAPTFVSVTYGAGGSTRDSTVRLTSRIVRETSRNCPAITSERHRSNTSSAGATRANGSPQRRSSSSDQDSSRAPSRMAAAAPYCCGSPVQPLSRCSASKALWVAGRPRRVSEASM